jgi:hypothetical protein
MAPSGDVPGWFVVVRCATLVGLACLLFWL